MEIFTLDHINSRSYTIELESRIKDLIIYDSSLHNTKFTESFNNCLSISEGEWVMVCNNDISLNQKHVNLIEQKLKLVKPGIYSPAYKSPHPQMYNPQIEVKWIEFVAPIFHRDLISTVGFLDSKMSLGYGVDMDYGYRTRKSGFEVGVFYDIRINHYEHKSQKNHEAYKSKAANEMHAHLISKYGQNWYNILNE